MRSQEEDEFLTINGIQTQSATTCSLIDALPEMAAMGVDVIRLSPQSQRMAEVVEVYAGVLSGGISLKDGGERLQKLALSGLSNGFWYARPGMDWYKETASA